MTILSRFIAPATSTVFLLGACAVGTPYVAPTGPSVATFTFRNDSVDPLSVDAFKDAKTCSGRMKLHTEPTVPPKRSVTVPVAAGSDFTWISYGTHYAGAGIQAYCRAGGTFLPAVGRSYVVSYGFRDRKCYLALMVEVHTERPDGSRLTTLVPEPSFRTRKLISTFSTDGPECEA